MDDFIAADWLSVLRQQGLDSFDALWGLQADWFEPPNKRRGGWSGVVRIELPGPDGVSRGLFLKRQENHTRRTMLHPLKGEPTFVAEMRNIQYCQEAGVPALEPVYYAQRKVDGKWRAILMTEELLGYRSLWDLMLDWKEEGWGQSVALRKALIPVCAKVFQRLHRHRLVHNALHPKHVFVRNSNEVSVRLIDLEKMRRRPFVSSAAFRDLDSFNRRAWWWSTTDRLRFFNAYRGVKRMGDRDRRLWQRLSRSRVNFVREKLG